MLHKNVVRCAALALADELDDGKTGYLIERALDEARAQQFKPFISKSSKP
jgi:uncharacterized oligopeptide transporter (OPT) family protein